MLKRSIAPSLTYLLTLLPNRKPTTDSNIVMPLLLETGFPFQYTHVPAYLIQPAKKQTRIAQAVVDIEEICQWS